MWKRFESVMLLFAFAALSADAAAPRRPNILLILADDLGYADLSVQGCADFQTPHIDSIATNGVRFKQGYVSNSVCGPSRAGLLSGRTGIGFEANIPRGAPHGLDVKLPTMADRLKQAGYKTFCVGKWHLGYEPEFHPNQRGFDEFHGLIGGSRSYYAREKNDRFTTLQTNGVEEPDPEGSYITDRLTRRAVDYLDAHAGSNPRQPFFMFLSYTAPHGPLEAKPGYAEKFPRVKDDKRRRLAGMMLSLDEGVGQVLKCLERNSELEKTLIVFLSDNGGPMAKKDAASNGALRGSKGSLWEGGVRVPFFAQWTGTIPAGREIDEPVISLDLFPTFGAVAGSELHAETDGINIFPLMSGKGSHSEQRAFFWRRGGMKNIGYREGKYKWLRNLRTGQQYLYDIEADPSETNNLIASNPERAERMRKKFQAWEQSVPDAAF